MDRNRRLLLCRLYTFLHRLTYNDTSFLTLSHNEGVGISINLTIHNVEWTYEQFVKTPTCDNWLLQQIAVFGSLHPLAMCDVIQSNINLQATTKVTNPLQLECGTHNHSTQIKKILIDFEPMTSNYTGIVALRCISLHVVLCALISYCFNEVGCFLLANMLLGLLRRLVSAGHKTRLFNINLNLKLESSWLLKWLVHLSY